MMSRPTAATIKRLFALSGNVCAFPNCKMPLVDDVSGKVTGRICHIKAQKPGGARYDPEQTEECHSFDNLILMCPIHHDVIDDDPESYTVERLIQIKHNHESKTETCEEPAEAVIIQLIASLEKNEIKNGSIIQSYNQSGGQVAHSIVNIGTQRFEITNDSRLLLINSLRSYTPEPFDITTFLFISDTQRFGTLMVDILNEAGWLCRRVSQISGNPPLGIIIQTPLDKPSIRVLIEWFISQKLKVQAFVKEELEIINIYFGVPH